MEIEKIYIYPIKSLRPILVQNAEIGPYGFVHDRILMLLKVHRDPETSIVSRLENMHISHFPKMALFLPSLEFENEAENRSIPTKIIVTYTPPKSSSEISGAVATNCQISIPLYPNTESLEPLTITMHSSPTLAYNLGSRYNTWFSTLLTHEVILAYIGAHSRRVLGNLSPLIPTPRTSLLTTFLSYIPQSKLFLATNENGKKDTEKGQARIAFQDCAHYLIVTTVSLADVSARLPVEERPMDVTKFRPNIVLSQSQSAADSDALPWAEDYWSSLVLTPSPTSSLPSPTPETSSSSSTGPITLLLTANCTRCASINVDYATGAPGTGASGSILKALQKDRRVDAGVKYSPCFGRYGFAEAKDVGRRVSVGMRVEVAGRLEVRQRFEWPGLSTS